jgi:hypothetical protein
MRRLARLGFAAGIALVIAGCGTGGSGGAKGAETRFLLLAHQPLSGSLRTMPDAHLVDLGHQACAALDANASSDEVVAELGGNPLPGSAEYNEYSFIVVDAATELCPQHKSQFGDTLPT